MGEGGMVGSRPSDAAEGEVGERGEVGVTMGDLDLRRPALSAAVCFLSYESRLGRENLRTNDLTFSLLPLRSRSGLGESGMSGRCCSVLRGFLY